MNAASRRLEIWQPPNDEVSTTWKLWCNYYLQQNTHSHTLENDGVKTYSQTQSHGVGFPSLVLFADV